MPAICRIIDGQTLLIQDDAGQRTALLARICVLVPCLHDLATQYVRDAIGGRSCRMEMLPDGSVEVFVQSGDAEFNLSDQLLRMGLALPCADP